MQKKPLTKFSTIYDDNSSENGHRRNLPQHSKGHIWEAYSKHYCQWWKTESIPPKIRNKTGVSTSSTIIQHRSGSRSCSSQRRERNKRNPDGKGSEALTGMYFSILSLCLPVSLGLKWVSGGPRIYGSCVCIHSASVSFGWSCQRSAVVLSASVFCVDLYILLRWSGPPLHSQLVFCMHSCLWRCVPDASVQRDVLHVPHLGLLLTTVLYTFLWLWVTVQCLNSHLKGSSIRFIWGTSPRNKLPWLLFI